MYTTYTTLRDNIQKFIWHSGRVNTIADDLRIVNTCIHFGVSTCETEITYFSLTEINKKMSSSSSDEASQQSSDSEGSSDDSSTNMKESPKSSSRASSTSSEMNASRGGNSTKDTKNAVNSSFNGNEFINEIEMNLEFQPLKKCQPLLTVEELESSDNEVWMITLPSSVFLIHFLPAISHTNPFLILVKCRRTA